MKKKLSPRKIKANRRNARKSTGPKTPVGKAIVAINALRHGLCSAEVVIPGLEKEEEYEMHRQAMLASLAPKDYLEAEMAEWVALNVWLLRRVARYEREMIAIEQETAEQDLEDERFGSSRWDETNSADIRQALIDARDVYRLLQQFPDMADKDRLTEQEAYTILWAVTDRYEGLDINEVALPEIPDAFPSWTAGLVSEGIAAIATHGDESPQDLLTNATEDARLEVIKKQSQEKRATVDLSRLRRERMLPEGLTLEKISRYRTSLERSLYRALHELERLQARRAGKNVPLPVAVDVDMAVTRIDTGSEKRESFSRKTVAKSPTLESADRTPKLTGS